jgi:hypothetical protein
LRFDLKSKKCLDIPTTLNKFFRSGAAAGKIRNILGTVSNSTMEEPETMECKEKPLAGGAFCCDKRYLFKASSQSAQETKLRNPRVVMP